jgi:hypothetical protein
VQLRQRGDAQPLGTHTAVELEVADDDTALHHAAGRGRLHRAHGRQSQLFGQA